MKDDLKQAIFNEVRMARVIKEFERAAKDEPIPSRFRERTDS